MITLFGKNFCESCFTENVKDPCEKCGFSAAEYQPDATSLPVGHKLQERYLIGGVIGKGGFGITYTAFDTKLERRVAIKEYYPYGIASRAPGATMVSTAGIGDGDDDVFSKGAEKFYEEARLVARFSDNQNIVSIHDFFYENSTVYYVMEFLQGESLKNYIAKHGVVSAEQAVFIAKEVSNALVSAHSSNILHRDIAPDNIMICSNGKVKLIDFGAARQVVSEGSQSLSVILKQGFAPLEQYQKKGKQGPWTDIYALGATVYYLITGDLLDDPMTRLDDDEEFSSNAHNLDEELWAIIKKATMLRPADRYKTIFEFREDLNKIAIGSVPLTISYEEQPRFGATAPVGATAPAKEVPPAGATMPAKEAAPVGATMPAKEEAAPIGATMPAKEAAPVGATMPAKEAAPVGATMPAKEAAPIGATMPAKEAESIGADMPKQELSYLQRAMLEREQQAKASKIIADSDNHEAENHNDEKKPQPAAVIEQMEKKKKMRLIIGLAAGVVIIVAIILGNIAYRSSHVKIGKNWYSYSATFVMENSQHISDISVLKNMTGLTKLDLYSNDISDISALKDLTNLTTLYLSSNNISDISALKDLTNLTDLSLWDNNISDISALKNLTNLTKLDLGRNNISDISALKDLTNLTDLNLGRNNISDISALKDLTNLTYLSLGNNNISDISALSNLTGLTELYLYENNISDISALKDLTNLTWLYLESNNISDLSPLKKLTKLERLTLTYNGEKYELKSAEDIKAFLDKNAGGTAGSNTSAADEPVKRVELDLRFKNISDISDLKDRTDLTHLNLQNNEISDISPLKNLTNLKDLNLYANKISDISALSNLTQLTDLNLTDNNISDISALSNLTELSFLYLSGNNISDLSPLKNLTKLKWLFLTYNGEDYNLYSSEEIKEFLDKNAVGTGTSELQRPNDTYLTFEQHVENMVKAYRDQLASINDAIGYCVTEMDGNGNPTYDLGNNYYEMIVLAGSDRETDARFEFYRYDDYRQKAIFMGQIDASHSSLVWDRNNGLCLYTPWNGYISEYRILLDGNKVTLEKDPVMRVKSSDLEEKLPDIFFREMTPKDDLSELTMERLTDYGLE